MHYDDIRADMIDSAIKEEKMAKKDVAEQEHYAYGVQPIEYMKSRFSEEEYSGYLLGNVIKYVSRYKKKNGLEDLEKAKVYLNWLIEENK